MKKQLCAALLAVSFAAAPSSSAFDVGSMLPMMMMMGGGSGGNSMMSMLLMMLLMGGSSGKSGKDVISGASKLLAQIQDLDVRDGTNAILQSVADAVESIKAELKNSSMMSMMMGMMNKGTTTTPQMGTTAGVGYQQTGYNSGYANPTYGGTAAGGSTGRLF